MPKLGKYEYHYTTPKDEECPCFTRALAQKSKGQLMDLVHPEGDICMINKTAFCKQPNYYEKWSPPKGKYLDYNLTETDTKMVKGDTKVHLISTVASYGALNPNPPPPPPPPPPPKKEVYFHGKGPCWEFIEEKYFKKQMEKQKFYKKRLRKMVRKRKRIESKKKSSDIDLSKLTKEPKVLKKHWSKIKIKLDPGIKQAKERWEKTKKEKESQNIQIIETPNISCGLLQKMRDNEYFHGRPPCWVFLDETWTEKYEEQQKFYKKRLKRITRNRKREEKRRKEKELAMYQ